LPDRIVISDGNGGISLDALNWMTDQQIALVQLDWRGQVSFVGGNSGYAANANLVERQLIIRGSQQSVDIARWLISEKIAGSIKTISEILPESENRETAISRLNKWLSQINKLGKSASIPRIMGLEGAAAAAYFQTWQRLPIKWSGSKRKPIPKSWLEIGPRTMGWRKTGQNARHPVNAMLNYGYGMLAAELRISLVSAGFDPGIGIMHGTKHNRIPLVYDLMEPLRPTIDAATLKFVQDHAFSSGDFTINKWGGCRLNPQMAKQIVKQAAISAGVASVLEDVLKRIAR
jgi:CRISPR-associated endonuclease Cas1